MSDAVRTPVIDCHVHIVETIAGFGREGELRSLGDGSGRARYATGSVIQLLPESFHADTVTAGDLIELMDREGVDRAVLLQGNYYGFQNLASWEAIQRYPDRLAGAAMYDPYAQGAREVRAHLFEELGFSAVKFECSVGSGLMALHPQLRLDDEVMDEALGYAAGLGQVIILDIGKCASPSWQIEAVRREIKKYPQAKFVLCHLLAPSDRDGDIWRGAMERLALPNVWMDLSSLAHNLHDQAPWPKTGEWLRRARDILGADRLLFGTDYPSALKEAEYGEYVRCIRDLSGFTREEKAAVLGGNAMAVFFCEA